MKINKSLLLVFLFSILFILSGYGRYSNEFLYTPVFYPFPFGILIDSNRLLVAVVLSSFILAAYFNVFAYPKDYLFYLPTVLLHLLLAIKLGLLSNNLWYFNFSGAIFLLIYIGVLARVANPLLIENQRNTFFLLLISFAWLGSLGLLFFQNALINTQNNGRFFYFSAHSNHAGILWAFCSMATLFLSFGKILWKRVLMLIMFAISGAAVYFTGSRGAMLSCAAGITALLYLNTKSKYKPLLIYSFFVILFAIVILDNPLTDFFNEQVDRGNTRSQNYKNALNDFMQFPLTGQLIYNGRPLYVENTLFAFMQLGGVWGFMLGLYFYINAVTLIFKGYRMRAASGSGIRNFYLSVLIMAMVASVFESFPLNFVTLGSFATVTSAFFLRRSLLSLQGLK